MLVADAISGLPTANRDLGEQGTVAQVHTKAEILIFEEDIQFPLDLSLVLRIRQQELNKNKSK